MASLSTATNVLSVFIVQKIIAVYAGPTGTATVGQLQNFIGVASTVSSGGIESGIVKYIAEGHDTKNGVAYWISAASKLTLACSLIVMLLLFANSTALSVYLFGTDAFSYIVSLLGISVVLIAFNNVLLAILNGHREYKLFVALSIVRSLVLLACTLVLTHLWNIEGALIAVTTSQALVLLVTASFLVRRSWFCLRDFLRKTQWTHLRGLLTFSLMSLSAGFLVPAVQIEVRNLIIVHLSIEQAGFWDAMGKISQGYLGVFTGTLAVYYLPQLSSIKEPRLLQTEIWRVYKLLMPVLFIAFILLYSLRYIIVQVLFSDAYAATAELFAPMLVGDFLKMGSWLLAYIMIAKAKAAMFIWTQLVFSGVSYLFAFLLIDQYGLQGVLWGQATMYLCYGLTMVYLFRDLVFPTKLS